MLIYLMDVFSNFPGERLLTYITFRSFMAILFSFVLGVFFGRKFIKIVFQLRFRDRSRDFGDISPRDKDGTPTMGGIFIFLSFLVSLLLWGDLSNFFIQLILFAAFWFTSLGFIDDYLKSVRGSNDAGLSRGWKLLFQSIFGIILAVLVLSPQSPIPAEMKTKLFVPFLKNPLLDLSFFYYFFIVLVIVSVSNAINFADGLDGLATVPSALVLAVYAIFAYVIGNVKAAEYLLFPFISGSGELVIALSAMIGALAAFLWFNTYPAEIFMGDTGSLLIGGLIGTTAVLLKKELLFLLAGGVFVIEFLSVFIQDVIGIRFLKRRILYRAPIHHTFQYLGIAEPKIVTRFWIVAIIFTLLSLITLKLR